HVRTSGLGVEPYGDDPAPLQLRIAEGGTINLHGSYCDAGLCVGQDADIVIQDGHTYTVSVPGGQVTDSETPGSTALLFAFDFHYMDVALKTVDMAGEPLPGAVFTCVEGFGLPPHEPYPSPQTVHMADGGSICVGGEYHDLGLGVSNGQWREVAQGHTYTINTHTNELISDEATPGATEVRFAFDFHYMDVALKTVDMTGEPLPGTVFACVEGFGLSVNEPYPSPQTVHMADGGSICVGGEYYNLGLGASNSQWREVFQGHTYTINTHTGELISDEATPGATEVRFAFDFQPLDLIVDTVDSSGAHLPGDIELRTPGLNMEPGTYPAPIEVRIADGGWIDLKAHYCDAGLCMSQKANLMVQGGHTYTVNVPGGEVTDRETPGSTAVLFAFHFQYLDILLDAVDASGTHLPGDIEVRTPGLGMEPGTYPAPVNLRMADGGNIDLKAHYCDAGLCMSQKANLMVQGGHTYTVNVPGGEVTDQETPGSTAVLFAFHFQYLDLLLDAVDASGGHVPGDIEVRTPGLSVEPGTYPAPVELRMADGGNIDLKAHYCDAGLCMSRKANLTVQGGHTYTVNVPGGEVTDQETPGSTAVLFAFDFLYMDVEVATVDMEDEPLPGTVLACAEGFGLPVDEPYPSPQMVHMADGGSICLGGRYSDEAIDVSKARWLNVQQGRTYRIDMRTGESTSESTPSATRVLFVAPIEPEPPCGPPPAGLVSWWPGEGDASDIQGGNDGRPVNGAAFAPGKVGQSFGFDGADDGVFIARSDSLDLTQEMTLMAWIKPARLDIGRQTLFGADCDLSGTWEFVLDVNSLGFHYVNMADIVSPGPGLGDTDWHHAAVVRGGSSGNWTYTFYIDGQLDGATAHDGDLVSRNSGTLLGLGRNGAASFGGLIDEAAVFGRALAAEEIQAVFAAGGAGMCQPPPHVLTTSLPDGAVGEPASMRVRAAGGAPPLSFGLAAGALPPGLELSAEGLFTGAPTQAGSFTFTVQVLDAAGSTDSRELNLVILQQRPCAALEAGVAGWWRGEGSAADEVPNGSDGTLRNGADFASGKVGQAFSLDGIDDHVDIPRSPALLDVTQDMTLTAWIKPDRLDIGRQTVIGAEDGLTGAWEMALNGHRLEFRHLDVEDIVSAGPGLGDTEWHHVAVVRGGSSGDWEYSYYVDGRLDGVASRGGDLVPRDTDTLLGLGRDGAFPFGGLIDEAAVFGRALSAEEIQAVFAAGAAGMCPEINQLPVAEAGPDRAALAGIAVAFDGSASADPDGEIVSFDWDFGDGAAGAGPAASHVYPSAGIFAVTLTVSDDDGATGTDTAIVTVRSPDQAIADLAAEVSALALPAGTSQSLRSKLVAAMSSADKKKDTAARGQLQAFMNEVRAQRGKRLTADQADALLAAAGEILASLEALNP
ncbi:MAG: LamG-like jellyroll fold domain-containing protein, partial [Elusimicrobiota bacterium]